MENYNSFSRRNKFRRAVPIRIRGTAPDELRTFLLKALKQYVHEDYKIRDLVFVSLEQIQPISFEDCLGDAVRALSTADWFGVYDVVEALYRRLARERAGTTGESPKAREFRHLANAFFEQEGYAYRISESGNLEMRGEEAFEAAIDNANIALDQIGAKTSKAEIHKALENLAKRPHPDLTGAVQHAMAGLECVANQIAGTTGLELGKLVKSHPERFPQPLNDVIPKLYGYASNNGRHVTEGREPDFAEAELIVGIAATVSTYLARKADR